MDIFFQILVESQGGSWSEETSSAKNFKSTNFPSSSSSSSSSKSRMPPSKSCHNGFDSSSGGAGYQSGGGGQLDFSSDSFKAQKEGFFSRKQAENSSRPE